MLDLPNPLVERFLAEGDARKNTGITYTNKNRAALGIGKGNKRLDAGLVERRLELKRLRFAGANLLK